MTGDPNLKREANRLTNVIRDDIDRFRNEQWEYFLQNLEPGSNNFWRLSKYFKRGSRRQIPTIHGPNGLEFYKEGKAESEEEYESETEIQDDSTQRED